MSKLLINEPPLLVSPEDYNFYSGRDFIEDFAIKEEMQSSPRKPNREQRLRAQISYFHEKIMKRLIARDGKICQNCGTTENLTIDHILAIKNGGGNRFDNLQLLCRSCNSKKGTR